MVRSSGLSGRGRECELKNQCQAQEKTESAALLRDSETLTPLFHIYTVCKEGKMKNQGEALNEAESLIAAVFPGPRAKARKRK